MKLTSRSALPCLGLIAALLFSPATRSAPVGNRQPMPASDMIISAGDSWWIGNAWLPVDSAASIRESVQMWSDVLNVKRIYWRGQQEEMMVDFGLIRKENLQYYDFFTVWERHLMKDLHLNQILISEAHRHGMAVYFLAPLFDFAGPPATGGCNEYPYYGQLNLTLQHPEWMPVDRYGVRSQNGPIELAYPDARKGLVEMYMYYVDRDELDGLSLFTYCENYGLRFEDEFGYSQPIVDEYKRRYGVDIRTQQFDKHLWRYLRGEYVTEFLRELKAALHTRGKRLSVYLNPKEPNFPEPWYSVLTAGRIYIDWERWVREGIVDDLNTRATEPVELYRRTIDNLLLATNGTPVTVGLNLDIPDGNFTLTENPAMKPLQPLVAQGMRLALFGTSDASYLKMVYPEQDSSVLSGSDKYAIIRYLAQVAEGRASIGADKIVPFTQNESILVRRQALKALAKVRDPKGIAVLETALADPESSVRSAAVFALLDLHGPESVGKLIALVREHRNFQVFEAVSTVLITMEGLDLTPIDALLADKDVLMRRMGYYILGRRSDPASRLKLVAGLGDDDLYIRFLVARGLQVYHKDPQVVAALIGALNDASEIVQDRAATSLAIALVDNCTIPPRPELESSIRTLKTEAGPLAELNLSPAQAEGLTALVTAFQKFGDGSKRADQEWGFRPVGNAILAFGAEGGRRLQTMIDQKADHQLAELAWLALNIRQGMENYCPVPDAEQENEKIYATYPGRTLAKP